MQIENKTGWLTNIGNNKIAKKQHHNNVQSLKEKLRHTKKKKNHYQRKPSPFENYIAEKRDKTVRNKSDVFISFAWQLPGSYCHQIEAASVFLL